MVDPAGPLKLTPEQLWLGYTRYPYLLARLATYAVVGWSAWALLSAVQSALAPVLASLMFAYLLDPSVDALERRGMTRTRGILVLLGVAALSVMLFALFLVPAIRDVLGRFGQGLPQLGDRLQSGPMRQVAELLGLGGTADLLAQVEGQLGDWMPNLAAQAAGGLGFVLDYLSTFTSSLLNLVLVPFFAFYFLRDFDLMTAGALELVPPRSRHWVLERAHRVDVVVGAWFRGQVEVAAILGVMYSVGLGVCFGLSTVGWTAGVAVGVLSGLLNFIPYVGTGFGMLLTFGLLLLDGAGWAVLVGAGVTFFVVQMVEGYLVTPYVVGEKVGLSPLSVILALSLGAELLGLTGMLLALPMAGIAKAFWPDVLEIYRSGEWYNGRGEAVLPE
jgi:predicted PurR-regulated permease PerM